MKTKHFMRSGILGILFLQTSLLFSQVFNPVRPPTNASLASFEQVIVGLDWQKHRLTRNVEVPCTEDYLNKSKLVMSLPQDVKGSFGKATLTLNQLYSYIEYVSENSFKNVKVDSAIKRRDKLINNLTSVDNAQQFILKFRTLDNGSTVTLPLAELEMLEAIYEFYEYILDTWIEIDKYTYKVNFPTCNHTIVLKMKPTKIEFGKISWELRLTSKIDCPCNNNSNLKMKSGESEYKARVSSILPENNFFDMRFTSVDEVFRDILEIECCDEPENDQNSEREDANDDGNQEEGSGSAGEKDKKCCDHEQPNNSIGFFPIININDNFEDTTFGLSAEYLYNMGSSFLNNEWYIGGAATYQTSSAQDGEITENFYIGALIIENRTPILPCLQWVQRVCGQYGQGSIEAFGSEDDFNQLTFGIHTGFNMDIAPNVSIGADATILEFGNQTFTPDNAPEQETDIGNFSLGSQRIRFGVRFFF